ncbi:MAG: hypothetical protein H6550_14825 [Chitinophagales bacterium]|nr:hypothetical protein [Chitinophagales bacterium]
MGERDSRKLEIEAFANDNDIPQEYIPFFVEWVTKYDDSNEPDENESIEEYYKSNLKVGLEVMQRYISSWDNGHSEIWAKVYSESVEDEDIAMRDAYEELRKHYDSGYEPTIENPVFTEAYNYCIKAGKSEHYSKAYATLTTIDVCSMDEVRAYADAVEEQIDKGHTELFAEKYAEHFIEYGGEIISSYYADYFQQAIVSGKEEFYAEYFANGLTEELANFKNLQYKAALTYDHLLKFAEYKFKADALEYCRYNNIDKSESFIFQYHSACINELFPADDEYATVDNFDEEYMKDVLLNANIQLSDPIKEDIVAHIMIGSNFSKSDG